MSKIANALRHPLRTIEKKVGELLFGKNSSAEPEKTVSVAEAKHRKSQADHFEPIIAGIEAGRDAKKNTRQYAEPIIAGIEYNKK